MPGGRPRKHATVTAATDAKKASDRRRYQNRLQHRGPIDFIAYEPPLPTDVPTETPPELGLRISVDIPIPYNEEDEVANACARSPPSAPPQPTDEDVEAARQMEQIRLGELSDPDQDEYEAAIQQKIAEKDARTAKNQPVLPEGLEEGGLWGEEASPGLPAENPTHSQASHATPLPPRTLRVSSSADEPTAGNAPSVCEPVRIPSMSTPNRRSPASRPSSKQKSKTHSTSFPVQKNTLLSWIQGPSRRPSTSSRSPQATVQRPPSVTLPLSVSPLAHHPSPQPTAATANTAPSRQATSTPAIVSPEPLTVSPDPSERTAYKLAKQLRRFQGCTHEQHDEADRLHKEHHQRADVHSACSSLQQITRLLRGNGAGGTPFPDVLGSPTLMEPADVQGVDYRGAFEGTSAEDMDTPDENLPRSLCFSKHHASSPKGRAAKTTFDIDSLCCFPTSLGIARQGVNWLPNHHAFLNLGGDIHFSLPVPTYNRRGDLTEKHVPLHKVPHTCFGSVIGMDSLFLYIFFPALHMESDHERPMYLSNQDQQLWYDAVLSPAIQKTVQNANVLQHYPVSAHVASLDSTALSAESFARKESSREQLLRYALQPQHLDPLWNCILESIEENPGVSRFAGATLFMHAKNTKLEHMDTSLTVAYGHWQASWSKVADPQFYSMDRTYVDLGKQTTSEDSHLPYDSIPENHEAEVFLWRRCCLEAHARTRVVLRADGTKTKGSPTSTTYPWATMRDTMGQTLFAAPRGTEATDGLIYSQFYALIKTPFDTSKVYVFANESLENLALDPGYVRSLQQEGGGKAFSRAACVFGYIHSKKRAHANLTDNRWRSYGIREEHRISLTMMEEMCEQWSDWDLYDDDIDHADVPLPYYVVPTQALLGFLYAQINKYCFLFEHTLAQTARTYSLPETVVMVVALRALRFCYGSNLLQRESLLYKDRWVQPRGQKMVVKEGLGMRERMERCGLGWFAPKFNWSTWRLAPPHGDNMLVGNLLMHTEYKRRWRAVQDLRDVYVRFHQASAWYDQYDVHRYPRLRRKWLEYLHVLVLEQFDADVWKTMLQVHRRRPALTPQAIQTGGEIEYCARGMKNLFLVNGTVEPPYLVTGNKMRFEKVEDLLHFLFLWDDKETRTGWGNQPYRCILQKCYGLIERKRSSREAEVWLHEFLHLVRLTHWVLPYATSTKLIGLTKTSRSQGLQSKMMWLSVTYTHPDHMKLTTKLMARTLYDFLWRAQRREREDWHEIRSPRWGTSQLIQACKKGGMAIYGPTKQQEYWVAGKRSEVGVTGFTPVWEVGQPPKLAMSDSIRKKTLDELEELMVGWSRQPALTICSIGDFFGQAGNATTPREAFQGESTRSNTVRSDSGSVFVPSVP